MPPTVKPTLVAQPIAQPTNDGALAPWPAIDKYPVVIGPGLSLQYISSVFRLSLVGYRQQYVDLLDEMLEKDPHAFSVLQKRVLSVAGGKLELTPARTAPGSNEEALAKELCEFCTEMLAGISDLEGHIASIAWALYYAMVGLENHWVRDGRGWFLERFSFIHSRRLSFPVAGSWDLYIWDQGQVLPGQYFGQSPTNGSGGSTFGLRVADAPGKFVIYAPQIRGNYPTREGLGRQIAYWLTLKLIATRGAPQYLERFAKPWPEATYYTGNDGDGPNARRPATERDIDTAKEALKSMGAGSLSSWVHPDTVSLDLRTPDNGTASKITYSEWISICDGQVSKAALGGTLSTEVGHSGGNRSLGETQKKSELVLIKHDAKRIAATLRRDVLTWMVRLNYPDAPMRLVPTATLHVEEPPDPLKIIEKASKAASAGMPVDADKVGEQSGVPLVARGDLKARRMFPILAQKDPALFDEDLRSREMRLAPEEPDDPETDDGANNGGDGDKPKPKDAKDDTTPDDESDDTNDEA